MSSLATTRMLKQWFQFIKIKIPSQMERYDNIVYYTKHSMFQSLSNIFFLQRLN